MIDKKFVMLSTSSASLHQYAAGCFLSWNDYLWSGPGRWRGICISLTQGCGCESELGSRVNPGGRKNRWNANNLIDISLNKTPIPVALIVLVSLALELRHGGRDQGVCGLGSIITALSAAGARAGHLSWPLLMSVLSPPLIPSSGLTPSAEWDWSLRDEDSWNTFPKWMGYIDRIKDWYTVYFIFVYIDKWRALQNSPWASLLCLAPPCSTQNDN